MHNQHTSGTVQDMPITSGIKKLFFNLPKLHRINTQKNQRCCDLSRRCIGVWNYQGQFDKRVLAVRNQLSQKNFTFSEKKINSKPIDSVSVLTYSISKEDIAPDPKHVGKKCKSTN